MNSNKPIIWLWELWFRKPHRATAEKFEAACCLFENYAPKISLMSQMVYAMGSTAFMDEETRKTYEEGKLIILGLGKMLRKMMRRFPMLKETETGKKLLSEYPYFGKQILETGEKLLSEEPKSKESQIDCMEKELEAALVSIFDTRNRLKEMLVSLHQMNNEEREQPISQRQRSFIVRLENVYNLLSAIPKD